MFGTDLAWVTINTDCARRKRPALHLHVVSVNVFRQKQAAAYLLNLQPDAHNISQRIFNIAFHYPHSLPPKRRSHPLTIRVASLTAEPLAR